MRLSSMIHMLGIIQSEHAELVPREKTWPYCLEPDEIHQSIMRAKHLMEELQVKDLPPLSEEEIAMSSRIKAMVSYRNRTKCSLYQAKYVTETQGRWRPGQLYEPSAPRCDKENPSCP